MRLNTRTGTDSGRQVGQDRAKAVIQNSSGSGWRQRNQRQDALCGNKRDFRVAASWQRAAEMQPCGRVPRNLFTPVLTLLFCQLQFDLSHRAPQDHLANILPKCGKCLPSRPAAPSCQTPVLSRVRGCIDSTVAFVATAHIKYLRRAQVLSPSEFFKCACRLLLSLLPKDPHRLPDPWQATLMRFSN